MSALIAGECAIFTIFVVAYVYYVGKSLNGPTPRQVLDIPIGTLTSRLARGREALQAMLEPGGMV